MPPTDLGQVLKGAFNVFNLDTHYRCLQTHCNSTREGPMRLMEVREGEHCQCSDIRL